MHQLLHDAALAFTYFGAFLMAALVLYVFVYVPLFGAPSDD